MMRITKPGLSVGSKKKQKGVNILQVLIGTVVGGLATIAAVNAVQGQRANAQVNEAFTFISSELAQAVAQYYYGNSRSLVGLTAGVSGTAADPDAATNGVEILIRGYGLRNELPWGEDWWEITADATRNTVTVSFDCSDIGGDVDTIEQRCTQLANQVNNAGTQMIGNTCTYVGTTAGDELMTCTYSRPL